MQRKLAIKVYQLPRDRQARQRVLSEARLVARLEHSRITQIHDVIEASETIALVMEYVPGCDLEELLCHVELSMTSILTIFTDLAAALAVARRKGIVHADLKASNVLITTEGRAKLTDFGIARDEQLPTPSQLVAGSPSCISPEQYLGQPMDVRSDLFALACLVYRLVCGQHPFMEDERFVPKALLHDMPPTLDERVKGLPPGLSEVVQCMLAKLPDERPPDTLQVRAALRQVLRQLPASAPGNLRAEAMPWFRNEPVEDAPPEMPEDLAATGRSYFLPFRLTELWSWRSLTFDRIPRAWRWAGLALLLLALGSLVHLLSATTRVFMEPPSIEVASGVAIPVEVSPAWLVAQIKDAAHSVHGPVEITGPMAAVTSRTLYTRAPGYSFDETLAIDLRCNSQLCLLDLRRDKNALQFREQAVLLSGASLPEWARSVRSAGAALYSLDSVAGD